MLEVPHLGLVFTGLKALYGSLRVIVVALWITQEKHSAWLHRRAVPASKQTGEAPEGVPSSKRTGEAPAGGARL
jgi:hypothetical protein